MSFVRISGGKFPTYILHSFLPPWDIISSSLNGLNVKQYARTCATETDILQSNAVPQQRLSLLRVPLVSPRFRKHKQNGDNKQQLNRRDQRSSEAEPQVRKSTATDAHTSENWELRIRVSSIFRLTSVNRREPMYTRYTLPSPHNEGDVVRFWCTWQMLIKKKIMLHSRSTN